MAHTIEEVMALATSLWGVPLKRVNHKEASGPCPFCGGEDRFNVWTPTGPDSDPRYWCRQCGKRGFIVTDDTPPELHTRIARLESKVEQHEQRLSALEQMHEMWPLANQFYSNLTNNSKAVDMWHDHYGVSYETIADRKLGYCPTVPLWKSSDSLTIPVAHQGKLYNIRHRLLRDEGPKYLPHMRDLGAMLFNTDDLLIKSPQLLLLEGEIKSIIISQETGLPNVAIMGMSGFKAEWANKLAKYERVYVCLDPDAGDKAAEIARLLGPKAKLVRLPVKADDFFVRQGGTASDFKHYLNLARTQ